MCIHIESTSLAVGTYELAPESEIEQREAQLNLTKIIEDPNQSLEEPKASFAQEGKPRSMNRVIFKLCNLLLLLLVH
jgi:hypothetical protein